MSSRQKLAAWALMALVASALLVSLLRNEQRAAGTRWASFLVGDPHIGFNLFQKKGCANCHAVNGVGGTLAPDLGYQLPPSPSLNQLVTAMWNHAPRMWDLMRQAKTPYPDLDDEDMAHLFAYLYTSRYVDAPGDAERGRRLFESKGCILCHAFYGVGGTLGPELASVNATTPIAWTEAMWNHAPAMETALRKLGLPWPKFEDSEMDDLLAYVREASGGPRHEFELLPANPDRGWQVFQTKSCIVCHAVHGEGGSVGPELGPGHNFPSSMVQFAGLMWNHSPEMWQAMQAKNIPRPTFTGREMADLIAFLHRLRYFEPGGSPKMGEMLFGRRGCSTCHGVGAEGTPLGPSLRGRGKTFTMVTLATALWRHGPKMYQRAQQLSQPWPNLSEGDIGDLLVFLNTGRVESAPLSKSRPPTD